MKCILPPPTFFKRFFLVFAFIIPLITFSQSEEVAVCGTQTLPEIYKYDIFYGDNQKLVDILLENNVNIHKNYLEQLEGMNTMSFMDGEMFKATSTHYDIPIKAWVYRQNNGTGNISTSEVYAAIDQLNALYSANTNISFYLLCDISFINNSNYANYGDQYFNDYTLANKTSGALNVHFVVTSHVPATPGWGGRANLPFPVFPNTPNPRAYSCAVTTYFDAYPNSLAHEIGHTLGLHHTHHPGRDNNASTNEGCGNCYQEAVSRSKRQGAFCVSTFNKLKCEVNGDFLCDTDADPLLSGRVDNSCNFTYYGTDNWGDLWSPRVENLMGYAFPKSCRTYFSPLQVAKMYYYINAIGINHPAFTISGPNAVCYNQTATFSVNAIPGATYYDWDIPNNLTIIGGGQGTTSITVLASGGAGGVITVMANCGSKAAKKNILNINNIEIDGYDQACPYFTYTYTAPNISNANYFWSATNGSIVSGQNSRQVQVQLNLHPSNQTTLTLQITGVCSNPTYAYKTIVHGDPPPPEQQCFSNKGSSPLQEQQHLKVIRNFESDDILLYPNPASNSITIIPTYKEKYSLKLFNSMGQLIISDYTLDKQEKYSLDVQNFPDGIYFIKLIGENKIITKKLILKK